MSLTELDLDVMSAESQDRAIEHDAIDYMQQLLSGHGAVMQQRAWAAKAVHGLDYCSIAHDFAVWLFHEYEGDAEALLTKLAGGDLYTPYGRYAQARARSENADALVHRANAGDSLNRRWSDA